MVTRDVKKLSRKDLLELLVELSEENDTLKKKIKYLENELESRKIKANEIGNIAEAALKLNAVFESAQKACDDYVRNVKEQTDEKCAALIKMANETCAYKIEQAEKAIRQLKDENKT